IETPFVGRGAELGVLRAAVASARAGTSRTVLLVGEEGIGKSRLVDEISRAAAGMTVLVALATDAATPLQLLADLVASWAGVEVDSDDDAIAATVRARAAALRGVYAPGLVALVQTPAAADGSTFAALVTALARQGGVVVGAEDVQRADARSLQTLAALGTTLADEAVCWVLTTRDAGAATQALVDDLGSAVTACRLGPIAAEEAVQLVDHVTGGAALSAAARARIEARAGGNPQRLIMGAVLAGAIETELRREAASVERTSEAERRRVTVLFADITGFTRMSEQLPPAEAYRAVSGCLAVLHETASKHGGSVEKYLGDCIMATFGVPIALEDAPRAAVNAAIEMRRKVREYNVTAALPSPLDVHIGINTGLGLAGDVSGALLREFTLMGEVVSVASKLKDVAPAGEVWVGPETERATASSFAYEPVPRADDPPSPSRRAAPSPLKRDVPSSPKRDVPMSEPEAFALKTEREQVYRSRVGRGETIFPELVGRDDELAALRERVAALARGQGGVAAVVGEAGLGKSRLLAELAASPEATAVRWVEGRSVSMGRTLRFHPFVDLLRSLLGLGEDHGADAFEHLDAALAPLLGDQREELAMYLATLIGVPLPAAAAARIADVRSDVIDRLQLGAVRTLLQTAAAAQPLVLFFEDVYWADRSSVEMLVNLIRVVNESPVLFLFAARPDFPETAGRLVHVSVGTLPPERVLALTLQPLDAEGSRRLLGTLFPHGGLPRASRERMAERAAGNPLFLEELLRALITQGVIETTPTGLRATAAIESVEVPDTVQEVILTRVDLLRPLPKLALQLAAVVGQRVAEPVLRALVSEPEKLAEILTELTEAQLLLRDPRREIPSYVFKHRLIQDVTYDSILETRRAELHRAVGRVVEEQLVGAPGYHGMLAYHYSMGNDLERAEEQLFLAGDDAARAGAPIEALDLLQESSRLYLARHPGGGDPGKRVALHKRLAGAYLHRGQMEESQRHYNEALAVLGEEAPTTTFGVARALARTLGLVVLDLYVSSGRARNRPPASERDLEIIALMFNRARAQTTADAPRFLLNGLETLRRLRGIDPATVPGAGGMYAGTVGLFSFGGISFDVSERFLALAERYVDPANVAERFLWRVMHATHQFIAGDWDARHEIPSADIDEALRYGLLWDVATHVGLETFKRTAQGRWDDCRTNIERLELMEETYADDYARSNRQAALAFFHTERRALEAAAAAAQAYLTSNDEVLLNLLALGTKAKVQVLADDLDAAAATLAQADALIMQRVPPWYQGFVSRSHLLLAAAEYGRPDRIEQVVLARVRRHRGKAEASAGRFAWIRPEVAATIARLRWARGRRRGALRGFARALAEAERLGMRPEAARIRADVAVRLLAAGAHAPTFDGQTGPTLLATARQALTALDLGWDLERLDVALGSAVQGTALAAALR
ncbi:MAG: AAA family ATPase, partial [Candidatus Binatia bacterium]